MKKKPADRFTKANALRAKRGLAPVELGFDYSTTIARLATEKGFTDRELAAHIGCTHQQLRNYIEGQIPNHITGEMLCALWEDEYGRYDPDTGKKTLPMSEVQAKGKVPVGRGSRKVTIGR